MKSSLMIIKIVLTVVSIVSIGTALGATVYFGVLKNNPPVAVQPTPSITQVLTPTISSTPTSTVTPNIDILNWKTYKNEKYGFEFKHPGNFEVREHLFESIGQDWDGSQINKLAIFDLFDKNNNEPIINPSLRFSISAISYNIVLERYKEMEKIGNDNYQEKQTKIEINGAKGIRLNSYIIIPVKNNTFIFDKSFNNTESVIDQILSTFKFTEIDSAADWKTYRNEKYGFEIKYPQDWVYKEDINTVYFGTPESKSGGYIWGISIHQPGELEQLVSQTGNQFNDRKEVRDKITLNTNILGTLVTVTTGKYTNWVSKKVYFEKNNQLFVIGNGAIIDDRFEIFYKSFVFTNKDQ